MVQLDDAVIEPCKLGTGCLIGLMITSVRLTASDGRQPLLLTRNRGGNSCCITYCLVSCVNKWIGFKRIFKHGEKSENGPTWLYKMVFGATYFFVDS